MTELSLAIATPPPHRTRLILLVLLYLHVAACFVSLFYVTYYYSGYQILRYDPAQLYPSLLNAAPLAALAFVFAFGRFSFGYFVGFGFYTLILGYLFLAKSSALHYDHFPASISAFASIVAFLAPALFITAPVRQWLVLSTAAFGRVLSLILVLAALVVAIAAFYNFRIVGISEIYAFRDQVQFPWPLRYAVGIFINALLPFAFACDLMRRKFWRAAAALLLLLLFYPITLTKLTLFAPFWLVFLALLGWLFETRIAVVLSMFLVVLIGDALLPLKAYDLLSHAHFLSYFGNVNFRLVAVPSIALDIYNDFFARHDLTYFCQITLLKPLVHCPYSDYLSVIMLKNYNFGAVNASLFATEGVASVGLKWAPLSALACGLVVAVANRLSAGLPPKFILLSAGILAQLLLNVPLSTSLLSDGAALLFLLWYVMPREMFEASKATGMRAEDRRTTSSRDDE